MIPTDHLKTEPIEHPFQYGTETMMLITGYRILQWWSVHGLAEGDTYETGGIRPVVCLDGDGNEFQVNSYTTWTESEVGEWRYLDGCAP